MFRKERISRKEHDIISQGREGKDGEVRKEMTEGKE